LKDIYKDQNTDESLIELTAQIISAATFGLIIRLIIEKEIGEEQSNMTFSRRLPLCFRKERGS
jgi:hypothetical protein